MFFVFTSEQNYSVLLLDDPVSNIRLCVVSLFPNLKQMLILSDDKKLKSSLDSAITRMEAIEKDRDVLQCLKGKIKEMNAQTVQNKDERLQEEKRRIQEEEDVIYNRQVPSVQQSSTGKINDIHCGFKFAYFTFI